MATELMVGVIVAVVLAAVLLRTWLRLRALRHRFAPVLDLDAEIQQLTDNREAVATEIAELHQQQQAQRQRWEEEFSSTIRELEGLTRQLDLARDELDLQSYGLYDPQFDFGTSEAYKLRIQEVRDRQKSMVKEGGAAICHIAWNVEGSAAKGRTMVARYLKLQLRAFNGECDAAVAKVNYKNIHAMQERIGRGFDAINKLGDTNRCEITRPYLALKLDELRLAYEYQEKQQQEKEEQLRIREEMREEERAKREFEKAQADAEKEERRYEKALEQAREELKAAQGAKHDKLLAKLAELEKRLAEAHAAKERAISQAQLTKSGYVYVISNTGSFGDDVYKIGMTRRLEPLDRVRELGDASVPFSFDVHAMIYSENAPELESSLHRRFTAKRLNLVNERKEFFHASLSEIEQAAIDHGAQVEFTQVAEAAEFRRSLAIQRERTAQTQPAEASTVIEARDRFERLRARWGAATAPPQDVQQDTKAAT